MKFRPPIVVHMSLNGVLGHLLGHLCAISRGPSDIMCSLYTAWPGKHIRMAGHVPLFS